MDGVKKTVKNTGYCKIAGEKIGGKMETLSKIIINYNIIYI